MKRFFLFICLVASATSGSAQLRINEISNGPSGSKEYVEFVVVGTRTCTDSTLDIRGTIFDDNPGWYHNAGTGAGSYRFANVTAWSAVPYGSRIVVYNAADANALMPADDPTDANGDKVYIVPSSSNLLEVSTQPAANSTTFNYSAATTWAAPTAASWGTALSLGNSQETFHIIVPSVSTTVAAHSVSYGPLTGGVQTPQIAFPATAGGATVFYNTGSSPTTQASWTSGAAPANETPGAGNSTANTAWVASMASPVVRQYVDGSVTVSGNGFSWGTAKKRLEEALLIANTGTCVSEIWVANGTYVPTTNSGFFARDSSFRILRNGIKVYGGFAGGETALSQRNIVANPAILSGDIGAANDSTDNVFHVVTIVAGSGVSIDTTTVLDGFIIQRGNADSSSSFNVSGRATVRQDGAGIYMVGSGASSKVSPRIVNCTFRNHFARYGGAIYCNGIGAGSESSPRIRNCSFVNNRASLWGGAILNNGANGGTSSPLMTEDTFTTNQAGVYAGAVFNDGIGAGSVSNPSIANCVFTGNKSASVGGAIVNAGGGTTGAANPVISGCSFTANEAVGAGGALYYLANGGVANPLVSGCTFTGNRIPIGANAFGGAIYVNGATGQTPSITNCTFTGNQGEFGGGVYLQNADPAVITNCSFSGNRGGNNGGALRMANTSPVVTGCTFSDNNADFGGSIIAFGTSVVTINTSVFSADSAFGGGSINIFSGGNFHATNCRFTQNYASGSGGAIQCDGSASSLRYCVFSGNSSPSAGAVDVTGGTMSITNCVLANNTAGASGGGALMVNGKTNVANTTFANNSTTSTSSAASGTIRILAGDTLNLSNSIVWGAAAQQVANGGTAVYAFSDVKGVTPTANNLNIDPKFINPADPDGADNTWGTTDDGLRLDTCSAALNAGSNALIPAGITQDYSGTARILLGTVDMGAYEHPYNFGGFPDVTITAATLPACQGASVTFTATATNPGIPSYSWFRNGTQVQTGTGSTYASAALQNNDTVWVVLTNTDCGYTDTSSRIVVTIIPAQLHVDSSVAVSGTGLSWASPLKTVDEALDLANASTGCPATILVKKGTYFPMTNPTTVATSRDSSLRILRNGIKLYGGFGGNDTTMATRNPTLYPTILSGDIGLINDSTDNSHHVVTIVAGAGISIDTTTMVNGFTIRAGVGGPVNNGFTVAGRVLNRRDGAAIYLIGGPASPVSPRIDSCVITRNTTTFGGAIYCNGAGAGANASPWLLNCTFSFNRGPIGAAMHNDGAGDGTSNPTIANCLFTDNTATGAGGAITNRGGGTTGSASPDISGCAFIRNTAPNGGAIYSQPNGGVVSPIISGCTFTGNIATAAGGAIYGTGTGSNPVITTSTFTQNRAASGGAIHATDLTGLSITNSVLTGNRATGDGGAMYNSNSSVSISGSTLSQDTASAQGGCILNINGAKTTLVNTTVSACRSNNGGAVYTAAGDFTVAASRFLNNVSNNWGGGITQVGGTMSLRATIFSGNSAAAGGGGVHSNGGASDTVMNCVFTGNSATEGGGLHHSTAANGLRIINSTFSGNTATGAGGGLRYSTTTTGIAGEVSNSIFWGNTASTGAGISNAGTTLTVSRSDVQGGFAGTGNLSVDPLFIAPTDPDGADNIWATTDDGLRVDTCSPVLNAGDNNLILAGTTTDIDGSTARILNTTVDMGAYEHPYSFAGFPDVTITATPQPACTGVPITFTATPVNVPAGQASYQWFRNSTLVQTGAGATFTSSTLANNDTVWVVLTNTKCNLLDTSNRVVVTVTGIPAVPGAITGNATPCVGTSQTYSTVAVTGATSYTWNVPGGTGGGWTGNGTTTTTPSFTTTVGTVSGNVTVTANTSCGASTPSTFAVTVQTTPAAPAAITGNAAPCIGSVETYSTTAVAGLTYTWTLPGAGWGGTSTTASLSATVGSASGNVSVSAVNICGTGAATTLAVAPIATPATPGSITGNATPCAGSSQTYSVTAVPGAATYTWTLPTGWTTTGSTANSITATPNSTAGNITVTAVNVCGTSGASTLAVAPSGISGAPSAITGDASVCAGTSHTYTITAVLGATAYNWSTPAGWTGTSTTNSLTTMASTTSGNVSVTVTNVCGVSAPASLAVTVNTVPAQPGAITGNATPCVGTLQPYNIAAVQGATGYTWTTPGTGWAGTSTTTTLNATTGSAAGNITVTADNVCGSSIPRTFAVTPNNVPAQPLLINGSAQPCIGVSTTYSIAAVANTTSYTWTVPTGWAGGTSTTTSVSTTPTAASGNVTVTASNVCGSSTAATLAVTPITTPAQPGTMTVPSQICQSAAGTYFVPAVPTAASYTWTLPGGWTGSSTSNTIIATPGTTAATTGTISVTATNACGTSPARTATVTVTPLPGTPSPISGPSPVCAGSTQVYSTAGSTAATSYVWTLPAGWTGGSTASGTGVTVGSAGGSISVRGQNVCGQSSPVSLAVTVNPLTPTSAALTATGPTTVCPGVPVTINATVTGGGSTPGYVWTRNGSVQSGATGTSFVVSNPVSGDVIGFQMTSSAVCPAPPVATATPITITVLPPVVPGININTQFSTAPTVCAATQLNFTANITGGGTAPVYQWRRNNAIVGTNSPTYSATNWTSGETVHAVLTSNAQCATPANINSNTVTVTVSPNIAPSISISASPSTTFVPGQPVTFTATIVGGGPSPLVHWRRNGLDIQGGFTNPYTTTLLTGGDTITARLTSTDPCAAPTTAMSNSLVMIKSTSVGELAGGATVGLYPNPNDGRFTLSVESGRAGLRTSVQVLNALGQVVWTREVITEKASWNMPIEIADVAAGIYMLRMTSEDGNRYTQRFEVRRRH